MEGPIRIKDFVDQILNVSQYSMESLTIDALLCGI